MNLSGLIRQELPHETYLEMAIQYHRMEFDGRSIEMLELAPAHPMVQLWQAYLLHRTNQNARAGQSLSESMSASPELVFPFRPEMTEFSQLGRSAET